jgi:hypothetical protein
MEAARTALANLTADALWTEMDRTAKLVALYGDAEAAQIEPTWPAFATATIAAKAGMSTAKARAALRQLELAGQAKQDGGNKAYVLWCLVG